ncbi:MAG: serine/threonine-protein kinase [Bacilli bacterium]
MVEIGTLFNGRYRLERYIGRGGMADVYKAFDSIDKNDVAIKIVREDKNKSEEMYQRFKYEIRIAASVQNHFNIVKILDFGKFENSPYMITEYINGQTLSDVLYGRRTLGYEEACSVVVQVLDALEELHLRGIVHRDIKPQNIYLLSNNIVKVADFGISLFLNEKNAISEKKKIVGTPQYLDPAVIVSGKPSFQQDIYALGITFFELIAGNVPFNSKDPHEICQMQIHKSMPLLSSFRANIPVAIEEVIKKATEKDPKKRYNTAAEMRLDINEMLKNKKMLRSQNWFERLLGLKGK